MKRMWIMAALAIAAAGCGKSDESTGGVSAEESRQLDNAAEMLDASPDSLTVGNVELGNGEEAYVEENVVEGNEVVD